MSGLMSCAICCMSLSVWAIIQLGLMGIFFYVEASVLIEDAEELVYEDYNDFITKTKANYGIIAKNCWIVAAIYLLMFALSYLCMWRARSSERKNAEKRDSDELSCAPPAPPKKKGKDKKKKEKS